MRIDISRTKIENKKIHYPDVIRFKGMMTEKHMLDTELQTSLLEGVRQLGSCEHMEYPSLSLPFLCLLSSVHDWNERIIFYDY